MIDVSLLTVEEYRRMIAGLLAQIEREDVLRYIWIIVRDIVEEI